MLLYRSLIRRRFCSSGFKIGPLEDSSRMGFEAMDFVVRHSSKMSCKPLAPKSETCLSYEKAINALNDLLPNSAFLQNAVTQQRTKDSFNVIDTEKYLNRAGMTVKDLEKLKVIHISGTKGKGSTCALVESILRSHGFRTGFYSSPHLISVTERIRLCGLPISKESFAKYFWTVYGKLEAAATHEKDYPPYFKFLTIMSFYVFLQEKVDVAIVEVGIGGQFDCTNVISGTKTVGITSLGLEHTQILGNTLEEIAWQKAGIIKSGSDVFTVEQENECLDVIKNRVKENNATIHIVPEFNEYIWTRRPNVDLLKDIKVQQLNTSLAIQLSLNWIHHNVERESRKKYEVVKKVPERVVLGIERCFWPGRCQLLQYQNKNFYLDGAHTTESIKVASSWFLKSTKESKNKKILIFNMTGPRQTSDMLSLLMQANNFDVVFFVPNVASVTNATPDIVSSDDQLDRCHENENIWINLALNNGYSKVVLTKVLPSIFDVMQFLDTNLSTKKIETPDPEVDILVTGSLHLIGACLMGLEEYDKKYRNFRNSRN